MFNLYSDVAYYLRYITVEIKDELSYSQNYSLQHVLHESSKLIQLV